MSQLSDKLAQLDLKIESIHTGFNTNKHYPNMDNWLVTVKYNDKEHTSEYHTGLGNRKPSFLCCKRGNGVYSTNEGQVNNLMNAVKKGMLRPNEPSIADVVSCWLMDASGADQTFDEWCLSFDYNNDSRSALETYLVCQRISDAIHKMFGRKLVEELMELEH